MKKYKFKNYRNPEFSVTFTDYMAPSYRIFDIEEHKAIAFLDRLDDAIKLARMLYRSGAIIL